MILQRLKLVFAPLAWQGLRNSIRLAEFDPSSVAPNRALIFACLHRDILPAIIHVRSMRPTLLVSQSPDGDILIRTLGRKNYGFVRGATGENGQRAFVALRRELERGHCIGLAVDGPKGPFGAINEGVLQLSRLSGAAIVPLVADAGRHTVLNTWDRTVVPHPLARVSMHRGAELSLSRSATEADLEFVRGQLAQFFAVERGPDENS